MSFIDVKIKIPDRTWGCEWRHALEACAEDFGDFKQSQLSWELDSEREGSIVRVCWGQMNLCAMSAARDGGADGKVIIERLCISLPYVETFNSKMINGFVPELRSRFSCFGIPMFYVYMLWTFYVCFTYPHHGYVTHAFPMYVLTLFSIDEILLPRLVY